MKTLILFLAVGVTLAAHPSPAGAQGNATVSGRVRNDSNDPLGGVWVRIDALDIGAATGADGTYSLVAPARQLRAAREVRVTASRDGFAPQTSTVILSLGVQLTLDFQLLRRDQRRSYYLTKSRHSGAQALAACAEGYHMASLWEIYDPSHLRYATELGFTQADSGFGPPTGFPIGELSARGWIRTGYLSVSTDDIGHTNCFTWTSDSQDDNGTVARLSPDWSSTFDAIRTGPWQASKRPCNHDETRVWCVQD
jgi:hypothetical protein